MMKRLQGKKAGLIWTSALCICAFMLIFGTAPAWGVSEHAFDPVLSLRGDGAVDSTDEVPDPGPLHPPKTFDTPCGTAVDPHGDIYVASPALTTTGGRIDVFGSNGQYLTEIKEENQPCSIAIDSEGNVYVAEFAGGHDIVRFKPEVYPPLPGTKYEPPAIVYDASGAICEEASAVAVDPSNDRLYVTLGCKILEYESAAGGGALIDEDIGAGLGCNFTGVDVYGSDHNLYVSGTPPTACGSGQPINARVIIFDPTGTEVLKEIKGTPSEGFGFGFGRAPVAVDQANGDVYVGDLSNGVVDQFDREGAYIGQIKYFFSPPPGPANGDIAVDDPFAGQSDYTSPNDGYVYVAQGESPKKSHLYAFKPKVIRPPEIGAQAATAITDTEALLQAKLNPGDKPTTYHFEYISQADFEADDEQFGAGTISLPVPDASAGEGGSFTSVSVAVTDLAPDTAYRFRLVASNCESPGEGECLTAGEGKPGEEGADAVFSTYRSEAGLPDGRAYELVTPPDTNGRIPTMTELGNGTNASGFDTALASPSGESVAFGAEGGSIPALGGGGFHDTYEAVRVAGQGWQSHFTGVSGAQAQEPTPGGISLDHRYSFWNVFGPNGSLATGGNTGANYVRRPGGVLNPACSPEPGGDFEFVGCGTLGAEPYAQGKWISPDGGHMIVAVDPANSGVVGAPLEACAHKGLATVYDRTASDGLTHCIVLPPEGAAPETVTEFEQADAHYQGTSADGTAVVVKLGQAMYVRVDNQETIKVASGETAFGGIAENGGKIVYLKDPSDGEAPPHGEILSFDTETKQTTQVGSGGKSILVNVSDDGSHVYFISPVALTGGEENDLHAKAKENEQNLYVWDGAAVRFIGIVDLSDVEGEGGAAGQTKVGGLGLWIGYAVTPIPDRNHGPAADPSRTTPDGSVLVFESHAKLTSYENAGHAEIYRFDADAGAGNRLGCISCNPTGVRAESDAQLESDTAVQFTPGAPVNALSQIANVTEDGDRAFFQSGDRLALGDTDGKVDVYEWVADGTGACQTAGGCIYLISGGRSASDDFLYAMTPDGSDVFFESGDTLVPQDPDHTPSIYDARAPHVPGEAVGFPPPPPPPAECLGEACQPAAVAPSDPTPASSSFEGAGNPAPARCRKGKRLVRRHGKARCVKSHKRHQQHKRTHVKRRASR